MDGDTEVNVKVTASTGDFKNNIDDANETFSKLRNTLGDSSDAMKSASSNLNKLVSDLRLGKVSGADFKDSLNQINSSFLETKAAAGTATIATAGMSRELIVLGHEVVSGNFSRIPGSLLVLSSRMGGLSLATAGVVGIFAAAGAALYEMSASAERAAEETAQLDTALNSTGKNIDSGTLNDYIEQLKKLPGINREAATSIINEFTRAHDIGGDLISGLKDIVADYAASTGQKADEAAKALVKSFQDPARGAQELQETFNGTLNPSIINHIILEAQLGDKLKAQADLFDLLKDKVAGAQQQSLSPLQAVLASITQGFDRATTAVKNFLSPLTQLMNLPMQQLQDMGAFSGDGGENADAQVQAFQKANQELQNGLTLSRTIQGVETERVKINAQIAELKKAQSVSSNPADIKQLETAEEELYQKLANLRDQDTQKAASAIQEQIRETKEGYDLQKQLLESKVATGAITYQQEFQSLQGLLDKEYEAEKESLNKELALYAQKSAAYDKVNHQIENLEMQHQLALATLQRQYDQKVTESQNKEVQGWQQAFNRINSAFSSSITGMITGTRTWQQAVSSILQSMLTTFINNCLKMGEQWILTETIKTSATVAGNATRTASDTVSSGAGMAEHAANATSSITTDAAQAAASTYADVAQIPYVGWILAPPAAAAAFAAVSAFGGSIPSAAGGWEVPHDTLAMVHKDEKILPASVSKKIDNMTGGGGDTHVHFNVSAMDGSSVKKFFSDNSHHVAQAIKTQVRNNNRGLMVR